MAKKKISQWRRAIAGAEGNQEQGGILVEWSQM
jgi:hypothetical protein